MTLVQCFKINLFRHQVNEEINPSLRGTSLGVVTQTQTTRLSSQGAPCPISDLSLLFYFSTLWRCQLPSLSGFKRVPLPVIGLGLTASHCRGVTPEPSVKACLATFLCCEATDKRVLQGLGSWGRWFQDLSLLQLVQTSLSSSASTLA